MVGSKEKKVSSVAVTSVGQVTIPKAFRDNLGIKDRVNMEQKGNTIIITRERTIDEILADIDARWTPEQRKRIKENAGKTVEQIRQEMLETPEGRAYFEEVYGR